jgi:hypothetical protein
VYNTLSIQKNEMDIIEPGKEEAAMLKALSSDGYGVPGEVQASMRDRSGEAFGVRRLASLLTLHSWLLQAWAVFARFLSLSTFRSLPFPSFSTIFLLFSAPGQPIRVFSFQLISWVCSVCVLLS